MTAEQAAAARRTMEWLESQTYALGGTYRAQATVTGEKHPSVQIVFGRYELFRTPDEQFAQLLTEFPTYSTPQQHPTFVGYARMHVTGPMTNDQIKAVALAYLAATIGHAPGEIDCLFIYPDMTMERPASGRVRV